MSFEKLYNSEHKLSQLYYDLTVNRLCVIPYHTYHRIGLYQGKGYILSPRIQGTNAK